jgi:glycosyltransferase involved in cell wall biosynthesis
LNISVIIPTYNYGTYIGRAIQSVFDQAYTAGKVEVLVIDDGSTDGTAAVIQQLQQQHAHLQYHWQANAGKAVATQKGIGLATGDVIFTLDADDWWLPGKIADTVAILQQHPRVVHVASAAQIVWADNKRAPVTEPITPKRLGKPLDGASLLYQFYRRNQLFGGGSTFACRASVAKAMYWHPHIDMYTDEWLVIQALLSGNSYFLPTPHSVWWVHQRNYSGAGGEAWPAKLARLQQSSEAVLQALQHTGAPRWLQQAYALKHEVRLQAWHELRGTKTMQHRWHFLSRYLLSPLYSPRMLWAYRAYMRLFR